MIELINGLLNTVRSNSLKRYYKFKIFITHRCLFF